MHENWLQSIASAILHEEYLNPVSESVTVKTVRNKLFFLRNAPDFIDAKTIISKESHTVYSSML